MALANVAVAQETNVTTLAKSARIGGEFRSELIYTNNGLAKVKGYDPEASTNIGVTAAKIKLHGNINPETEYGFRFNLLDPGKDGPLEYGYGTHWLNQMMGFSFGKMKVIQGGWDNLDSSYRSHAGGKYFDNLVFDEYTPMIAFHVKAAGEVTLQLVDDKVTPDTVTAGEVNAASFNKTEHPTFILGWKGEFGPISPLVDFGSYDNNKSRYFDVGVKTEMNGLYASLDFWSLNHVMRVPNPTTGKFKEATDTATSISLNVAYEVKNLVTPWLYFSTYDRKQADEKSLGMEDAKFNSEPTDPTDPSTYAFDDNGVVYGVGVDVASMGKGWTPFLALVNTSGKFEKPSEKGKEETRSQLEVKLGVLGEI
jgi:hypothetical protein